MSSGNQKNELVDSIHGSPQKASFGRYVIQAYMIGLGASTFAKTPSRLNLQPRLSPDWTHGRSKTGTKREQKTRYTGRLALWFCRRALSVRRTTKHSKNVSCSEDVERTRENQPSNGICAKTRGNIATHVDAHVNLRAHLDSVPYIRTGRCTQS